jgi:hypothetical protein
MKIKSTINKFACQWRGCGLIFEQPEPLYKHLTEDHIGRKVTGNLCLTCHWGNCKVTVEKRDHITSHVRVHVPFKPHECPVSLLFLLDIFEKKKKVVLKRPFFLDLR